MRRRTQLAVVAGGATAAIAGGAVAWYRRLLRATQPMSGMFANGMAYGRVGNGPKALLFIRGGPGNTVPTGRLMLAMGAATLFKPFLKNGYAVWIVTRKRDMPRDYTVADMAEDYAELVADEFGGKVDLVIGEAAYGSMIGFWLAARHPDCLGHLVAQLAGYQLSERGRAMELEYARLASEGRFRAATTLAAEFLLPDTPAIIARVVGAVQMWLFMGKLHPYWRSDVVVEARAVAECDAREVLPAIRIPVLVVGCDRDVEFSRQVYEETARLIPDGTLKLYEGRTTIQVTNDVQFALDVVDFVRRPGSDLPTAERAPELAPATV